MSGETVFFFVAINERPNETMHLTVYQPGSHRLINKGSPVRKQDSRTLPADTSKSHKT